MLIFINPTVRNISAHESWSGIRMPFAGKPKLWQILAEAGWIGSDVPTAMDELGPTPSMVEFLAEQVRAADLYVTNAVKCVDDGSNLLHSNRGAAAWPILAREIELVRPRHIMTFGLIPFQIVAGRPIRLADELWAAAEGSWPPYPSRQIGGVTYPVFPCYVPTGRGNPVAALRMLTSLQRMFADDRIPEMRSLLPTPAVARK